MRLDEILRFQGGAEHFIEGNITDLPKFESYLISSETAPRFESEIPPFSSSLSVALGSCTEKEEISHLEISR